MSDVQSISAKVTIPNKQSTPLKQVLTLDRVTAWINAHGFDEFTSQGLIAIASRYPNQALPHFCKNINLMIARVRQNRKMEQHGLEMAPERTEDGKETLED